jgi:hypothetical protein
MDKYPMQPADVEEEEESIWVRERDEETADGDVEPWAHGKEKY